MHIMKVEKNHRACAVVTGNDVVIIDSQSTFDPQKPHRTDKEFCSGDRICLQIIIWNT